jgi:hypothetical protein
LIRDGLGVLAGRSLNDHPELALRVGAGDAKQALRYKCAALRLTASKTGRGEAQRDYEHAHRRAAAAPAPKGVGAVVAASLARSPNVVQTSHSARAIRPPCIPSPFQLTGGEQPQSQSHRS